MIEADTEKDMDGFKTAFLSYAKALVDFTPEDDARAPGIDLTDMEKGLRAEGRNMHLIAKVFLSTYPVAMMTTLTRRRSVRFPIP